MAVGRCLSEYCSALTKYRRYAATNKGYMDPELELLITSTSYCSYIVTGGMYVRKEPFLWE